MSGGGERAIYTGFFATPFRAPYNPHGKRWDVQETSSVFQWQGVGGALVAAFGVLFFLLLSALVVFEVYRRRTRLRERVAHEARAMLEILEEHSLSPEEIKIVADLVTKHAAMDPLRAVTTRQDFDRCVEAEMKDLASRGDQRSFEQMGLKLRDVRGTLGLDYIPYGQPIHSTREIHPGQWMSVARAGDTVPQWMRMVVEEVDESYLTLSRQPKPGEPNVAVAAGDEIRCSMWRDDDARYTFGTTVAFIEEIPSVWRLAHTRELNRLQARGHFRVRHDQTSIVELLNAPVDGDLADVKNRRAVAKLRSRITSLSAGGCALVVQQPVSRHMLVRIFLEIPRQREPLPIEARIVAESPISGGRYLLRTTFAGIDDATREQVSQYVLQRQHLMIVSPTKATG